MLKLPQMPPKRKPDSTIALINIVFLMLIFFMMAGRISIPLDQNVNLALSEQSPPSHLQNVVVIRRDGQIYKDGVIISLPAFWKAYLATGGSKEIRVVADRDLPAHILLKRIAELRSLGAQSIRIITQTRSGGG